MKQFLRHVPSQDKNKANLKVDKAQRGDSGKYKLILSNSKGDTEVPIEIEVIDKPGAPEGPLKVSDVFDNRANLAWNKPLDDGGSPILHYVVEKLATGRDDWQTLETVPGKQTSVNLNPGKLTPGKEYKFRVRAVNAEGESDNLETDHKTKAKNPYDEPKSPGTPHIADWDNVCYNYSKRKI